VGKIKYFAKAGFTLIELLIVIAILGILAAAVMIAINPNKRMQEARDATRLADNSQLSSSISEYFVIHGAYPPDPSLSTETEFASDEGPNWIPGLENLPQDPNQAGIRQFLARILPTAKSPNTQPQVAGTQSATFTSDATDGQLQYIGPSGYYPPDYKNCYAQTGSWGIYTGQTYKWGGAGYLSYNWKSYFSFDTSSIPGNATIISSKLQLTAYVNWTGPNFMLKVHNFDWGNALTCPPSGSTSGGDWGGNPPDAPLVGTFDATGLSRQNNGFINEGFSVNLTDLSVINKLGLTSFMISSESEEANIQPNGDDALNIYTAESSNVSYRPHLIIEYTTEPQISPEPSPKGCKNKKHIYCYIVTTDHQSAILWAQLENEEDKRIYYKPTANCKNTPPPDTFLNYCINNP